MTIAKPLSGDLTEEAALEWLALNCQVAAAGQSKNALAKRSPSLSATTLSTPPRYVQDSGGAAPLPPTGVSFDTARVLQNLFEATAPDSKRFRANPLTGLLSRLKMSPTSGDLIVPASFAAPLFKAAQRRRFRLSDEERLLMFDAAARLLGASGSAKRRREILDQNFRGVEGYLAAYVEPVLEAAIRPPSQSVHAVTMAARLWLPEVRDQYLDAALRPCGFRVFRVFTYLAHLTSSVEGTATYAQAAVRLADADYGDRLDAYPGRSLEVDTAKQLLLGGSIGADRDQMFDLLWRRALNEHRPYRERAYAAWALDHFEARQDAEWAELEGALRARSTPASARLAAYVRDRGQWRREERTELERSWRDPDPAVKRPVDEIDRGLADLLSELIDRTARPGTAVNNATKDAIRRHLLQALLSPNGRWRRQVADTFATALIADEVCDVLGGVLTSESVDQWVKDRAAFIIGFLQPKGPDAIRPLLDTIEAHWGEPEDSDVIELIHSCIHAAADTAAASDGQGIDSDDLHRLRSLIAEGLERGGESATRIDLASAYAYRVMGLEEDFQEAPRSSDAAAVFWNKSPSDALTE